ncbi:hypothetical protein JCM8097_002861 [Rhodosporidiobolus ruineniae]
MRTTSLTLSALTAATAVSAFQYSIGVGKSEVTGQPGVGFDPSYTVIVPHNDGNTLAFEFLGGTHRVVQTAGGASPCTPNGGYDTGLVTVANGTLQGSGPTQTFQITNDTEALYFADIGEDNSPCYLGAVFCINTNEASSTDSCHAAKSAALELGQQFGVTSTPVATGPITTGAASTGVSSGATTSAASSGSNTASAVAPSQTARQNNDNAAAGSHGQVGVVGAVLAALIAALA